MTDPIVLTVFGIPSPQGSKSTIMRKGKPVVIEGSSTKGRNAIKEWRRAVSDQARRYLEATPGSGPIGGPVTVAITFAMPVVPSDRFRTRHTTKPDIDKLARGVLDALTSSGLLVDDSRVWRLRISKSYALAGSPGARIDISQDADDEDRDRADLKRAAKMARSSR